MSKIMFKWQYGVIAMPFNLFRLLVMQFGESCNENQACYSVRIAVFKQGLQGQGYRVTGTGLQGQGLKGQSYRDRVTGRSGTCLVM